MLAIDPAGDKLYVARRDEDKLLMVPPSILRVIADVAAGEDP